MSDEWKSDVAAFMRSECNAIMGPEGAGYSQEPVAVYGAAAARIEALQAELDEARAVIKPFSDEVYNDNGDVTLDTSHLRTQDWLRARAFLSRPKP